MLKRRGFTLIELLVVIAIIAILAAILFPVFVTAKEKGRQSTCCSNMKQIVVSTNMYVDDHNGVMPLGLNYVDDSHYTFLADALLRYVKTYGIWDCPSGGSTRQQILNTSFNGANYAPIRTDIVDFGYNLRFGAVTPFLPNGPLTVRAGAVKRPTKTIMLGDAAGWDWSSGRAKWTGFWGIAYVGPGSDIRFDPRGWGFYTLETRHNKGANFVMVDGHVKWYMPTDYEKTISLWDIN